MRLPRPALISALMLFGVPATPVSAFVPNPMPRVCNAFPKSDYVFTGKVLSDRVRWHEYIADSPSEVFRIRVDRIYKGKLPSTVNLYTEVDSGRGVLWRGQEAVVFANRKGRRIFFDGSTESRSGAEVPKIVAEIGKYLAHPPHGATIRARVNLSGQPLKGVRLLLTNGKARLFVRTNSNGMVIAQVDPGRWSVRIAEAGWASRRGIYSYDFAEPIRLRKGGCADLEIETAAPGEKLQGPGWRKW